MCVTRDASLIINPTLQCPNKSHQSALQCLMQPYIFKHLTLVGIWVRNHYHSGESPTIVDRMANRPGITLDQEGNPIQDPSFYQIWNLTHLFIIANWLSKWQMYARNLTNQSLLTLISNLACTNSMDMVSQCFPKEVAQSDTMETPCTHRATIHTGSVTRKSKVSTFTKFYRIGHVKTTQHFDTCIT